MSVYKRGKSWYYDFQYRGERYTGCVGVVSKTVAKEVLAKKKAEASEGRYVPSAKKPSPRLAEFVDEYFAHYGATRRPSSVIRHRTSWNAIAPVLGDKRLDVITPIDLERYRRKRKQAGKSDVSINRELGFLRHVYNTAIKWDQAVDNPVKKVRFAKEDNGRARFLSVDEEERLLAHCNESLRPLIITALNTGLRKSELLSLTWKEVDFDRRMITVRAAYAKNSETRSVPMNAVLHRTLAAVRIMQSNGPVFRKKDGKPYRDFRTAFERAIKHAEISDFKFHDLRHTFASRLVMAGVDLPTVKELMGHKHINMTLRYTHLASSHKKEAVGKLESYDTKSHQFSQQ